MSDMTSPEPDRRTPAEQRLTDALHQSADQLDQRGHRLMNPAMARDGMRVITTTPTIVGRRFAVGMAIGLSLLLAFVANQLLPRYLSTELPMSKAPNAATIAPSDRKLWDGQDPGKPISEHLPSGSAPRLAPPYVIQAMPPTNRPAVVTPNGMATIKDPACFTTFPVGVIPQGYLVYAHSSAFTGVGPDVDGQLILARQDASLQKLFRGDAAKILPSPDGSLIAIQGQVVVDDPATGAARQRWRTIIIDIEQGSVIGTLFDQGAPEIWLNANGGLVLTSISAAGDAAQSVNRSLWQAPWSAQSVQPLAVPGPATPDRLVNTTEGVIAARDADSESSIWLLTANLEHMVTAAAALTLVDVSPAGDRLIVTKRYEGRDRMGALNLTTGHVTWWPVEDGELQPWHSSSEAVINQAGTAPARTVECSLSSGSCRVLPAGSGETVDLLAFPQRFRGIV